MALMTGADLRAARKATGMNQMQLAAQAGIGRAAVSYWENKAKLDCRGWAIKRMAAVLGVNMTDFRTTTRARVWTDTLEAFRINEELRIAARAEAQQKAADERFGRRHPPLCCAKTRKGLSCRNAVEPGRKRCKFHGGKSTGARTPEGIARIVEAQKRRWARYHAEMSE